MKPQILLVLALCACGPVDVPTVSTGGGGSSGASEATSSTTSGSTGPGASGQADGESSTTGGQCDINIEGDLEMADGYTFSPCYDAESFVCTTCSEWCETAGLGACHHIVTAVDCVPPQDAGEVDACDATPGESPPGATFRCACGEPTICGEDPGQGGVYMPDATHTVSGCFDDVGAFACGTCSAWCEAGGYGECVGGAPLSECGPGEEGLGYTIGCDEQIDGSTAWRCVCNEPLGCDGWALGAHDFIFQGCCDEPFATCSEWCTDRGAGPCAYVLVSEDACANELPYPYCDADPWAEMPSADLSVRCVCMS